jgi:hypothetical protein
LADITMPQLGETVTEGTITRWLKQVGDAVAEDEVLFEVSTDKVDSEVPSPAGGVLSEILVLSHGVTDLLQPAGDRALGDGLPELGHRDVSQREGLFRSGRGRSRRMSPTASGGVG